MREKLLDLMKNEGLKPSQLAEMLEINPAGVSHILAGRNKPGFDLLQKILRRFPQINPDWLLLDSSQMYRDVAAALSGKALGAEMRSTAAVAGGLFDATPAELPEPKGRAQARDLPGLAEAIISEVCPVSETAAAGPAAVEKVVIFYEDKTFESFNPKRR